MMALLLRHHSTQIHLVMALLCVLVHWFSLTEQ